MQEWPLVARLLGDTVKTDLLIGGQWRAGTTGERIDVVDPSTGDVIESVASGNAADATAAVDAAAAAQPAWAATAPRVRSEILRNCWQTLIEHTDELAELIVMENGKPRSDAVGEVSYAAEFFRWNAEETVRIHGSIGMAPGGDKRIIVQHPPMGVVVMVTPWNFPAAMITRKLAQATQWSSNRLPRHL
jgi:succinate-semialdehyde dehydrogenase/glutarate-semialdehyde dehydrogenase